MNELLTKTMDSKLIFFVIRNKVGKTKSIFCAEFKYVFSSYQARFLSDERLNFEENLYWHYITKSVHYTLPKQITVDDLLLHFAFGTSLLNVHQQSVSVLELHLPWYHFAIVEMSRFVSDEEQLASNVGSESTLSHPCCLRSSSESECHR